MMFEQRRSEVVYILLRSVTMDGGARVFQGRKIRAKRKYIYYLRSTAITICIPGGEKKWLMMK